MLHSLYTSPSISIFVPLLKLWSVFLSRFVIPTLNLLGKVASRGKLIVGKHISSFPRHAPAHVKMCLGKLSDGKRISYLTRHTSEQGGISVRRKMPTLRSGGRGGGGEEKVINTHTILKRIQSLIQNMLTYLNMHLSLRH